MGHVAKWDICWHAATEVHLANIDHLSKTLINIITWANTVFYNYIQCLPSVEQHSLFPGEGALSSCHWLVIKLFKKGRCEDETNILWNIQKEGRDPLKLSSSLFTTHHLFLNWQRLPWVGLGLGCTFISLEYERKRKGSSDVHMFPHDQTPSLSFQTRSH